MTSAEPAKAAPVKAAKKPILPAPVAASAPDDAGDAGKHRTRIAKAKPYPPVTLQVALAIADAIRAESRSELGLVTLANGVGRSPAASQFRALVLESVSLRRLDAPKSA
jgi:hypothetical protein